MSPFVTSLLCGNLISCYCFKNQYYYSYCRPRERSSIIKPGLKIEDENWVVLISICSAVPGRMWTGIMTWYFFCPLVDGNYFHSWSIRHFSVPWTNKEATFQSIYVGWVSKNQKRHFPLLFFCPNKKFGKFVLLLQSQASKCNFGNHVISTNEQPFAFTECTNT